MTTQREPDTSAEGLMLAPSRLRWWRGKVSNWLHRQEPIPRETPDGISLVDELGAAATEIERLRALADTAECKGENTKLREALTKIAKHWDRMGAFHHCQEIARAALAPASGEKAT